MTIKIATRLRPFSHTSSTISLIPKTSLAAEIYPAYVRIFDPATAKTIYEHELSFGPLEHFTVILDLEKGRIEVSGEAACGFIRYYITPRALEFQKGSKDTFSLSFENHAETLEFSRRERLSLGCHKAQDATAIFQRQDLTEILPVWFFLAQSVAPVEDTVKESASLFTDLKTTVLAEDANSIDEKLTHFFKAGFKSLFFPRLIDDFRQGFKEPILSTSPGASPLLVLQKSLPLLRRLFFSESEKIWHFLPTLPKEFHAGRILDLLTKSGHLVAIEWTKKSVFRVTIKAAQDDCFAFKFHPDIRHFRVSTHSGKALGIFSNGQEISLSKGEGYLLDRFER
jgi:hypothetical protein